MPPPTKKKPPATTRKTGSSKTVTTQNKTFAIQPWSGENEGERIVIYSSSGMGKTTLAALAPNPVFIGVDPGGRKLRKDGKPLSHLPVEGWDDLRAALVQPGLFKADQTLVVDTLTRVESEWCIPHILDTVTNDKGGKVKYIERYGYGKGWQFVLDYTRQLLTDLEHVAAQGVNVILLCQENSVTVANSEGADFLQDGPKLCHTRQSSARLEVCEWADHVFRIGYYDTSVRAGVEDRVGKVSTDDTTRVIYTQQARHFMAKSRPIVGKEPLPDIIAFDDPTDDSLWTLMF